MTVLKPRQATPALNVNTLSGPWSLAEQTPKNFTMVVVYRGLHCPICMSYLKELNRLHDHFVAQGVSTLVISSDSKERAEQALSEWKIENLTLGYELSVEQSQAWGLHRSASRGNTGSGLQEPAEFTEPGLFLIRPDGTLYWSNISTMPFARPHFKEVLTGIGIVLDINYPARGELV